MATLFDRLQDLQEAVTRAARSPQAQQVRAVFTQELPAWLGELGALTPVQAQHVSRALNSELTNLVRVCAEEQKVLSSRESRNPLAVEMSLARVAGVTASLEPALSSYALALRHSDPRLAAIGTGYSTGTGPLGSIVPRAQRHIQAGECRKVAEQLRGVLHDVAGGAERIQNTMRGHSAEDPATVAGALAQAQVLVGWLRQEQDRLAGLPGTTGVPAVH